MSRYLVLIALFSVLAFGCSKAERIEETELLSNKTFQKDVKVDGHEFDGLIIENCVFDGGSLSLGNVDSVIVRNCTFKNIKNNGLKIGFIGPSSHISVENCSFENIGFNGVDSHEDALHCQILNCQFINMALSETGAAMAQPHHAIYWKGKDVLISGNYFDAGDQPFGNSISVRSSGIVRNNIILNSPKNGIMYYSNHPGGDSLFIENNFLVNTTYGISVASLGKEEYHNKNVVIRFNSIIQKENYSIYISEKFENTTEFGIYGNILVNPTENYFRTFYEVAGISDNLTRPADIGFVNAENGDLHLNPDSEAVEFCNGLLTFPLYDIDGDLRTSDNLNAGADG